MCVLQVIEVPYSRKGSSARLSAVYRLVLRSWQLSPFVTICFTSVREAPRDSQWYFGYLREYSGAFTDLEVDVGVVVRR